jgi:hypothetical protein
MKPKQYCEEFKRDAPHLPQISGESKTELECDLDLSHSLWWKWELRSQINHATDMLARSDTAQLRPFFNIVRPYKIPADLWFNDTRG